MGADTEASKPNHVNSHEAAGVAPAVVQTTEIGVNKAPVAKKTERDYSEIGDEKLREFLKKDENGEKLEVIFETMVWPNSKVELDAIANDEKKKKAFGLAVNLIRKFWELADAEKMKGSLSPQAFFEEAKRKYKELFPDEEKVESQQEPEQREPKQFIDNPVVNEAVIPETTQIDEPIQTQESDKKNEGIWYEGIIEDLLAATDPNMTKEGYIARRRVRDRLKEEHNIDIDSYINEEGSSDEKKEKRFYLVCHAVTILSGEFNPKTNVWRDPERAIKFLKDKFGIVKPEDESTEAVPAQVEPESQDEKPDRRAIVLRLTEPHLIQNEEMMRILAKETQNLSENELKVLQATVVMLNDPKKRQEHLAFWKRYSLPILWALDVKVV